MISTVKKKIVKEIWEVVIEKYNVSMNIERLEKILEKDNLSYEDMDFLIALMESNELTDEEFELVEKIMKRFKLSLAKAKAAVKVISLHEKYILKPIYLRLKMVAAFYKLNQMKKNKSLLRKNIFFFDLLAAHLKDAKVVELNGLDKIDFDEKSLIAKYLSLDAYFFFEKPFDEDDSDWIKLWELVKEQCVLKNEWAWDTKKFKDIAKKVNRFIQSWRNSQSNLQTKWAEKLAREKILKELTDLIDLLSAEVDLDELSNEELDEYSKNLDKIRFLSRYTKKEKILEEVDRVLISYWREWILENK